MSRSPGLRTGDGSVGGDGDGSWMDGVADVIFMVGIMGIVFSKNQDSFF